MDASLQYRHRWPTTGFRPIPERKRPSLLAMARILLLEDLMTATSSASWMNWQQFMSEEQGIPDSELRRIPRFAQEFYSEFTPEFAQQERGIPARQTIEVAREIGRAGSAFATHVWGAPRAVIWADGRSRAASSF